MASITTSLFFFINSLLIFIFKCSEAKTVPALFVFGDSGVDVGNNNYLPTIAKANYPYYGIDFPTRKPTGRFCNGKNPTDFAAEKLNLPSPPPYLSLLFQRDISSFLKGVNFASAAAGIMNGTGSSLGKVLPLTTQVDDFATVYEKLVQKLGFDGVQKLLSESIIVVEIGGNDIENYSSSPDPRKQSSPQQFVDSMIRILKAQTKRLYNYGGRKFVFPGLGLNGCSPMTRANSKNQECNEELNSLAFNYNNELKSMLQQLQSELKDIKYSYFDTYGFLQHIFRNPATYGFSEIKAACCGLGKLKAQIPCLPISVFCSNRSNHVYWDRIHPTEATYRYLVDAIFDGPTQCTFPMNLRQLVGV